MNWTDYVTAIVEKQGVALIGWPEGVEFKRMSLQSSIGPLRKLRDALRSGECRWEKVKAARKAAIIANFEEMVADGDAVRTVRKASKKRGPLTIREKLKRLAKRTGGGKGKGKEAATHKKAAKKKAAEVVAKKKIALRRLHRRSNDSDAEDVEPAGAKRARPDSDEDDTDAPPLKKPKAMPKPRPAWRNADGGRANARPPSRSPSPPPSRSPSPPATAHAASRHCTPSPSCSTSAAGYTKATVRTTPGGSTRLVSRGGPPGMRM